MSTISHFMLRKLNIIMAFALVTIISAILGTTTYVVASSTSNFTQTINAGTLATDIVDGSYVTVGSPAVAFTAQTFSFSCGSTAGTFGSASENIYVSNPDAADNGWTLTLAPSTALAVWDSAGTDFDFNDPGGSGCTDGADGDSLAGQMTVDASAGTLSAGACAGCDTTGVTKGTSAAFNQGTTDSITLLTAATTSADIGDWKLIGVDITQTIPAEQPAAADYDIDMVLTVTAS